MAGLVLGVSGAGFVIIGLLRVALRKDRGVDDWLATIMMILAGSVLIYLATLASS